MFEISNPGALNPHRASPYVGSVFRNKYEGTKQGHLAKTFN